MIRFITYEGKAALVLLAFYLFFRFLLKKETFHRFNRMVLIGSALLSFILPLCIITIKKPMEETIGDNLSPFTIGNASAEAVAEVPGIPWWHIALICLYWAGAAFVLVRLILSILSIYKIIRQGRTVSEEDGCKIIVTDRDIDPFSWMRYIVLSRNDVEKNSVPVIAHEMAHVKYGHSIEVLIVDIFSIFQWFNPAMWMLRSDLKEIHEYEADDAVLSNGINLKDYQYLLIRKAVGKSGYSVANSFNHSILKNRITMMSKSKSPLSRSLRALYALPLICLCLALQAQTVIVPNEQNKDTKKPQISVRSSDGTTPLYIILESGQEREISSEEFSQIEPGRIKSMEILKDQRAIDQYGPKAANGVVKITMKLPDEIDEEVVVVRKEAVPMTGRFDAVASKPLILMKQITGNEVVLSDEEYDKIDRSRINTVEVLGDQASIQKYTELYGEKAQGGVVLITLKRPQELDEVVVVSFKEQNNEPDKFYLVTPETMPRFQGGDMSTFTQWLARRITHPCNHSGTVKVGFEVGTDGSVSDVKILESVCEEIDAAVISVVSQSPKWEPATDGGHPVAQYLTIPIVFRKDIKSK